MEENANELHFEWTDEYRDGQSCGYAACPLDSRLIINCLNVLFSAGTARSAAA